MADKILFTYLVAYQLSSLSSDHSYDLTFTIISEVQQLGTNLVLPSYALQEAVDPFIVTIE